MPSTCLLLHMYIAIMTRTVSWSLLVFAARKHPHNCGDCLFSIRIRHLLVCFVGCPGYLALLCQQSTYSSILVTVLLNCKVAVLRMQQERTFLCCTVLRKQRRQRLDATSSIFRTRSRAGNRKDSFFWLPRSPIIVVLDVWLQIPWIH